MEDPWKNFCISTIIVVILISLGSKICAYFPTFTSNVFLATLFGAMLYGAGLGMIFTVDCSSGGTDIIGRLLQHFFPELDIGKALLLVDAVVILMSLFVFREVDLCLWGVVSLIIATYVVDFVISRLNVSTLLLVVTDNGAELARMLVTNSSRGCTVLEAKGAYTNGSKTLLMCAVKEREAVACQERIKSIDKDAFIIFAEAKKVEGNGFVVYQ